MNLRPKKGDVLLFAGLLIAALAGAAWWVLDSANDNDLSANGGFVVSQSKSGWYRCDPLAGDVTYEIETPGTGAGNDAQKGINTVRISGGTVEVTSANCGNQVCVGHDPVSHVGEQIVCLPHGVVVEVVEHESDATPLH